jgi:PAS domain S-box-containing protein
MKLQGWFFYFISTVAVSFLSVAQNYTFTNFNYQNDISLNSILSVEESEDGYLWFGTDGAGLMRYDGESFDFLEKIQSRNNRHINDISFYKSSVLFSTMYRGIYSHDNDTISRLSILKGIGGGHAIFYHHNKCIILQDRGLSIFKDSSVIQHKSISPFDPNLHYFGNCLLDDEALIFSSKMNYCVKGNSILELNDWLGLNQNEVKDFVVGYKFENRLFFIDKYLRNSLSLSLKNVKNKSLHKNKTFDPILFDGEEIVKWDKRKNLIVFITNKGRLIIFETNTFQFKLINNNSNLKIINPTDVLVDRNSDIWVTTTSNGAFRISLDPFFKLSSDMVFKDSHISFIAKTKDNNFILSVEGEGTFIGEGIPENHFVKSEGASISSMTTVGDLQLVSTDKGVFQIEGTNLEEYLPLSDLKNEKVSLIINAFGYLWYSVHSEGLFRKDLQTGKVEDFSNAPAYIHNGIVAKDSTALYFGTNYGVVKYDRAKDELLNMPKIIDGKKIGTYVGNSVIDSHGTIWFSFDNGLMGITNNDKIVSISEADFLPSLLIYTLNSDKFGHLIIGSNKGITVLKVNKNGKPIISTNYNKENGFYGYQTHMRSSFQMKDGSILLGTLGGLILVRPELFERKNKLNKPIVFSIKNKNIKNLLYENNPIVIETEDNNLLIEFKSINTKSNAVSYRFRLKRGIQEVNEWTDWSLKQEAVLNGLLAGSYTFEVQSSIDGENESKISSVNFNIDIPYYKNKWFIIIMVILVVLVNVLLLSRISSFNRKNIILSRDVFADRAMAKSILIFGAITNTFGHLLGPRIDDSLEKNDFAAISVGLLLLSLYFVMTYIDKSSRKTATYLVVGYLILLGYQFVFSFLSDIHPFYFAGIIMVSSIGSLALKSMRSAVFLSLAMGVFGVVIMFGVENAKYNQYLFLMGMAIVSFLMIFKTYLRNNSLEKLIFTSGIINKGNALVVAFDKKGKISYSSENVEELLGMTKPLKGENVLFLNDYQPAYNELKSFSDDDLINQFKEGSIFVTPLITAKDEVVYYQWSCKQFSDELRVILGQDVTEKINLESYYELIVKNADDLIFQTDIKGNFTFVNEKCCEIFDRTKSELLNLSIFNVVEPSFHKRVRSFFKRNIKRRNKGGYREFLINTPSEEIRWLGLKLSPMRKLGAENIVTGFLGLARDITNTRKTNVIIKEQNKDIKDSINYARRIQFNMLPDASHFEAHFQEHFIMFKPKDIVSGDFFWLKEVEGKTILILSDCAGHGVPGSFMTLLGINILNQIILEAKVVDPGEILNQLDNRLTEVLPRDGQNRIQDGMEAVVCVFDKKTNEVEYALAGGRFVIKNNEKESFEVIKGQSKHIGDVPRTDDFSYKTESVPLLENQIIYLFSDGYPDQFGGARNKKLTIKKFLSLLDDYSKQPIHKQGDAFKKHFNDWIGNDSQTDDITLIGVKGVK